MNKLSSHIKNGNFKHLIGSITKRFYSKKIAYGLKRDLEVSHPPS